MFIKLCRIGNDPSIRYTPSGDAVLNLSLAYNYGRKDADGKRPTQWLEASIWGKQAEAVQQYLHKGDQLSVCVDDLHIETYPKKDGGEGFKLSGRIVSFDFANSKQTGSESAKQEAAPANDKPAASKGAGWDDLESDIPFLDPYKFCWRSV